MSSWLSSGPVAPVVAEDLGSRRQAFPRDLRGRIPEPAAHERLGTVKERHLDRNAQHRARRSSTTIELNRCSFSRQQPRPTVDAQRVVDPGNHAEQGHLWIRGDLAQAVQAVVAGGIGEQQRMRVKHAEKAGLSAARRDVGLACRSRRRHHHERAQGEERHAVVVKRTDLPGHSAASGAG
jgi:hypothetical protein